MFNNELFSMNLVRYVYFAAKPWLRQKLSVRQSVPPFRRNEISWRIGATDLFIRHIVWRSTRPLGSAGKNMIRLFIHISAIILLSCVVIAQDSTQLKFDDFKVTDIFNGKPREPDLSSHKKAKMYHTVIRKGSKSGVNFAGHYNVVIWGCGTSCQAFAIIDVITGKVYFSDELPFISWGGWWESEYGLKFRADSNLLIVYGRCEEKDPKGIFYFVWAENKLRLIKSIV
jgi:hypothetical protein